jgi:hypothetical protein
MVNLSRRRRAVALAGAFLAVGLPGCAVDSPAGSAATSRDPELLTPWLTIDGGWRLGPSTLPFAAPAAGPRIAFAQPVGVAVRGDTLLVADAGARTVWRLDRTRDAMAVFAPFSGAGARQGASLHVGADFHVWAALPAEHMVVEYDPRGRAIRRWLDEAYIPHPVAVAVPEDRSLVIIGDGASAQVVVFDPLGRAMRRLGGDRTNALQSIAAMALGPRGLHVLDRLGQQVVVFGPAGEVVGIVGENQLVQPRAMAVDRTGRVFISDDADQRIKVFRGPDLLGTTGGSGRGPGRFGRIEAMAVDGNLLYVADSLNARVQVFMIAPPSLERERAR